MNGDCDCNGGKFDCAGVCRGPAVKDDANVCNGGCHIDWHAGVCDCLGSMVDACGACGGPGVPEGWVDCVTPPDEDKTKKIKDRVIEEGGAYYNTWLRVTLVWENCNDLDLSVIEPDMFDASAPGLVIDYDHPKSALSQGHLDIDKNAVRC